MHTFLPSPIASPFANKLKVGKLKVESSAPSKYLSSPISYLLSPISTAARRSGQAMVEFVIAILAIVIVVAGFFQLMEIVGKRGDIFRAIRGEAGKKALSPSQLLDRPDYIREWKEGDDEFRHTADDESVRGSISVTLGAGVVDHSVADASAWPLLDEAVNSDLAELRGGLSASAIGLIQEKETEKIELMPAMRNWIIGKDYVVVGSELWLPRLSLGEFDQ